jgi:DNA helicase II / ATP-dependent DNA helicase PcrA
MSDLLHNLNDEQAAAVTHVDGPLMIVAGAGTGKTHMLTRRIAWLIEQNHAKPENILALTFTDKAAGEMEERVDILLPYGYADLQISTFHSFCEKLLREYGAEIGLSRDFKMMTELDAWLLMRQNFDKFDLDHYRPLGNPTKFLKGFLTHFSRAKDSTISPEDYGSFIQNKITEADPKTIDEEEQSELARISEMAGAYKTYQDIILENDGLDFGDLILFTLKLLQSRPKILRKVQDQYKFVLVDEFQDTNKAQYELVKLIASPKNNITVVGDDDQAIYKFRGASLENILRFEKDYPNTTKVVLTKNYRSSQEILDHSHGFIQTNNPHRLESIANLSKKLSAECGDHHVIEHIHADTLENEVAEVIKKIISIKNKTPEILWSDFAVLVRSNNSGTDFAASFDQHGIPFQFLALKGLYTKKVILDTLSLLRAADFPHNSPNFFRVLTLEMYNVNQLAIAELNMLARRKGKSLFEACLAASETNIETSELSKITKLLDDLTKLRDNQERFATEVLIAAVKETDFLFYLNKQPEREKAESFRLLQQFYERVRSFESRSDDKTLHAFLEEFDHERDAGEEGSLSVDLDTAGPDMVKIMTVHAAKGLEFKYVFIVNLVDRRFPSQSRKAPIPLPDGLLGVAEERKEEHLEEERRLFYVAMTRAKNGLFFTSASDYGGARKKKLSRFLTELGFDVPDAPTTTELNPFEHKKPEVKLETERVKLPVPKQFSFTQLAAFKSCPLQYKFAHVLKVPVFGKSVFSFGKTMHNTLQQYFGAWIERTSQKQADLFDAPQNKKQNALPVSEKELMEIYESYWQDDWYKDDDNREEYRKKGEVQLKAYFKSIKKNPPKPLFIEQGFTLKFGDVILKGQIDRIDEFEDGVEVIDYKTGKPKTAKDLKKEDKEQLLMYQIAVRDVLGLNPKKLSFHYLEDNSVVSFSGKEEELIKLQEDVVERVDKIRNSSFIPKPGFACNFCDFKDICDYRQK